MCVALECGIRIAVAAHMISAKPNVSAAVGWWFAAMVAASEA